MIFEGEVIDNYCQYIKYLIRLLTMSTGEILTPKLTEGRLLDPELVTDTCLLAEVVCRFGTTFCDETEPDVFFRKTPKDNMSSAYEDLQCGICGAGTNITHDGSRITDIEPLLVDDVPSLLVCKAPTDETLL
jgi:hypothetical protein